MALMANI